MARVELPWILIGLAALSGGGSARVMADAPADGASASSVVVVEALENCSEASPERARWLADQARQRHAFQRAGECYLAAGEPAAADRAFIKASAEQSAVTARNFSATVEDAKAQARRLREAFRGK